jgi:rRNA maturation protein Rpf1
MSLCQAKNSEVFALERKVKDLIIKNEEKDKQIISMLSMAKDFKQLVESEDKFTQTEFVVHSEIEQKLVQTEEKNAKLKEMVISQIEEIQKLKAVEYKDFSLTGRKKAEKMESKVKSGGYVPLFLRKPKDSSVNHV